MGTEELLQEAMRAGVAARRLDDYGNALAIDVEALDRLAPGTGGKLIEAAWRSVVLTPIEPAITVRAWSDKKQRGSQFGTPYTSYPFDPEICARLACGYLSMTVHVDVRRVAEHLTAAGFQTEVLLSPEDSTWFRVRRGNEWITVPDAIGERILYEAMQPESLVEALEAMLAAGPPIRSPLRVVPLFANEHEIWL